jgi:catechol 2,3-dioxygenase-like lactoylglutathione lyase family enzyme
VSGTFKTAPCRARDDPGDGTRKERTMIPARLSVVTLVTGDVLAQRAFYESLGWRPAMPPRPDFARFALGGAHLTIWTEEEAGPEVAEPLRALGDDFRRFTMAVAVEDKDQVDAAIEGARRAGARIVTEPEDKVWGGRSGNFADPEGNVWEVVFIPGTQLGADGMLAWPEGAGGA